MLCDNNEDHGISEVKSTAEAVHYQVSRGNSTIVLWDDQTMANPFGDSKSFQKEKRRLDKQIASFFDAKDNGLFSIGFGQCEVKTSVANKCQISIHLPNFCKPIVFQPFAFFKDGARSGGAYFTLSSTLPPVNQNDNRIKKLLQGCVCVQTL